MMKTTRDGAKPVSFSPAAKIAWAVMIGAAALAAQLLCLHSFGRYFSEAYTSESSSFQNRKLYANAQQRAEQALRLNPRNGYALFHLGSVLSINEQNLQARAVLERAIAYMPHQPNLLRLIAQIQFMAKDYPGCVATLERYFRMDPSPEAMPEHMFQLYAQALYRCERVGEASVVFSKAAAYRKNQRSELLQSRVINALMLNQAASAEHAYRRFRRFFPKENLNATELLTGVLAVGKLSTAVQFLERLRTCGDLDLPLLKALALAYVRMDRAQDAIESLRIALRDNPHDSELHLYLGDAHWKDNNTTAAKEAYRRHLEVAPGSVHRKGIEKKLGAATPPKP